MTPGARSGAITTRRGPLVLLFYDGYEWRASATRAGGLAAQLRRFARWSLRSLRRQQLRTGFYSAFEALRRALTASGCDVRVNDYRTARRLPGYPVGAAGYPTMLGKIPPGHPVVFGPGDFGDPSQAEAVARDERFCALIQPCDWFCDIYRPACGDKIVRWAAPIDVARWVDASSVAKSNDVLIYDKIRWARDELVPRLYDRVVRHLEAQGLRHQTVRYGHHPLARFAAGARTSRAMIFLCEHETQGLAYQEAMAVNVPVLAWDEGRIIDPTLAPYGRADLGVSSVPYFDPGCGDTFTERDFEAKFDDFWSRLASFSPRRYVVDELSPGACADRYLDIYFSCLAPAAP